MSLYADENIGDFEDDGGNGQAEEGSTSSSSTRRRTASKSKPKDEEERDGEEDEEEEEEEEEAEEEEDDEDEYDADEESGGSKKSSRSTRSNKKAASKTKAKTKATGKSRAAAAADIPPELMRRSSRQVNKPLRYAEQLDKEEDEKKKKEDDKEKQASGGNAKGQRGTKRTRASESSENVTIAADEAQPSPPQRRQSKAKAAPVVVPKEEETKEEEDVNVVSTDQSSPALASPAQAADAAVRASKGGRKPPAAKRETATEEPEPKKPKVVPSSPARTGAVRRGRSNANRKNVKRRRKLPMPPWDPVANAKLAEKYPDGYWTETGGIEFINKRHPLKLQSQLQHPGNVFNMVWSSDGQILATCSSLGSIRLWDTATWKLIQELRDADEEKIEEFYALRFTPDNTKLFAAGKLKHRDRWSNEDEDNQVAPGPIKLFDVVSGKVLAKLQGHTEEILCIKTVVFKEKNYLLSASQDGYIIKWHLDDTWTALEGTTRIDEETTNMALGLSFVPNCGNKYFMSAADGGVKIYDFEKEVLLQQFEEIYTGYCDCIKFIRAKEYHKTEFEHYLITRGVEMLSNSDPNQLLRDNACHLWKLTVPNKPLKSAENSFRLERVRTFSNPSYFANSWPAHITSNGRYLAAPTSQGEVFIWNLRTGDLVATLTDHEDRECRDVLFHPTRHLMLTCCDDSTVKVYAQDENDEKAIIETVDLDGEIDVEGELADGEGEELQLVTGTPEDDMDVVDADEDRSSNGQRGTGRRNSGGRGRKDSPKGKAQRRMRIEEELEAEFGDEAWGGAGVEEADVEEADKEWLKIEKEWQKIEDHYQKIEREWSEVKKERKRLERDRALLRKLKEEAGLPVTDATTTTTTATTTPQEAAAPSGTAPSVATNQPQDDSESSSTAAPTAQPAAQEAEKAETTAEPKGADKDNAKAEGQTGSSAAADAMAEKSEAMDIEERP